MDVRTVLYAGSVDELHGLLRDPARIEPAMERLLDAFDVMPEERDEEREALRASLHGGKFYEGKGERGRKVLDRMIVRLLLEELKLSPVTPGYQAYRYEWLLAFLERAGISGPVREHVHRLAHGRRLGDRSGSPELVPYYAWLSSAEVGEMASALPDVLERMEAERASWSGRPWRAFRRRGSAHDAAYWLVQDLLPVLAELVAAGSDAFALTGAFRGIARGGREVSR